MAGQLIPTGRYWLALMFALGETSARAAATGAATCKSCELKPLKGFVVRSGSSLIDEDGSDFRFVSINVPNIHRIELQQTLGDERIRKPTAGETYDALCSLRQMNGRVTRTYVLSHGRGGGHYVSNGQLNDEWFVVLDQVIATAQSLGVRLIIPFVNTVWVEDWGTTADYASWARDSEPKQFFYSAGQRAVFKDVVSQVLNRINTITGRRYMDEYAILAWELGNELHDVLFEQTKVFAPPREWTQDLATHIKTIDSNHLVIDGGLFSVPSLDVLGIDAVGSTFYGRPASALEEEVVVVEEWNRVASAEQQKVYLVKEFGLIEQKADIPVQNMLWVNAMLDVTKRYGVVAGAMYWSLRFRAEEGGFFNHYEFGGNIRALHWPGFTSGPPNYEIEVFEALQEAAQNITSGAAQNSTLQHWAIPHGETRTALNSSYALCAPTLVDEAIEVVASREGLIDESEVSSVDRGYFQKGQSAPCLSFIGSTGATQYELWADMPGAGWRVIAENINDTLYTQLGVAAAEPGAIERLAGKALQEVAVCLRACSKRGALRTSRMDCLYSQYQTWLAPECSACSNIVTLKINPSAPTLKLCTNSTGAFRDYEALETECYFMQLSSPFGSPLYLLTMTSASVIVTILLALCASGSSALLPAVSMPGRNIKELRMNGGRLGALDVLRLGAVAHIILHACLYGGWVAGQPELLRRVASWGPMQWPFLFLYAGFVAAVRYGAIATSIDVWPLVWRRLVQVYPLFVAFVVPQAFYAWLYQDAPITGRYIFMIPFAAHAWRADLQFENHVNSLSWVVGPLVVLSAFQLPICARLQQCGVRMLCAALSASYVMTAWQAAHYFGMKVFVLDEAITWLALRAYAPAFVAGCALGTIFESCYSQETVICKPWSMASLLERFGLLVSIVVFVALACFVELEPGRFIGHWARHGLLLPVHGLMLWSAAAGTDRVFGPLLTLVGESFVARLSRGLWLPALLAAPMARMLSASLALIHSSTAALPAGGFPTGFDGVASLRSTLAIFGASLLVLAAGAELLVRMPLLRFADHALSPQTIGLVAPNEELSVCEKAVMYYSSMIAIMGAFAFYALDGGQRWVTIGEIQDGFAADAIHALTWLLYLPFVALGFAFAGMVIYAPVFDKNATPTNLQLQRQRFAGGLEFRLVFRIVTRGNSPDLVKSNVRCAHSVLETALPKERWLLEVVTDMPLNLAELDLPVQELIVPTDFKPPGECLFKARALHYATQASPATRKDWIIHLDEETWFDEDTVAHVLEYCIQESKAVAAGTQLYGHIGQGVILYNTCEQVSLICALADTIRVSDDFGKFALQYRMFEQPLIGMHGSFVVCSNAVEIDIGFDYGLAGSITEDTYFAMACSAAGVHVKMCGGRMYEQSPFSVNDFAKQRCRWFTGLLLCCCASELPRLHRFVLGTHMISWACCPLLNGVMWLNWSTSLERSLAMRLSLGLLYAIPLWGYILGFVWSFSPERLRHGVPEYLMMLFLQIVGIPLFALMEAYGVALAFVKRSFKAFDLVAKEKNKAGALGIAAPQADEDAEVTILGKPSVLTEMDGDCSNQHSIDILPILDERAALDIRTCSPETASGTEDSNDDEAKLRNCFVGVPRLVEVPYDRKPIEGIGGRMETFALPAHCIDLLRTLRAQTEQCECDIIVAILSLVISTYSREDEFVVGLNTEQVTPLRIIIEHSKPLSSLCAQIKQQRAAAKQNPQPIRSLRSVGGLERAATASEAHPKFQFLVQTDMAVRFLMHAEMGIIINETFSRLDLHYDATLFDVETVAGWTDLFHQFMAAACVSVEAPVNRYYLLSEEKAKQVASFVGKSYPFRERPIFQLFQEQVAATPAAEAVVGAESFTYAELGPLADRIGNEVAHLLRNSPVPFGQQPLVAIILDRSVTSVAAIYGVLSTGAAYVPLDPSFPTSRIAEILADLGQLCPLVLVDSDDVALRIPVAFADIVSTIGPGGLGLGLASAGVEQVYNATANDLVYCMYTSGTTGKPKGVTVQHRSLAMRVDWLQRAFGAQVGDRVALKTPYIFGVSEWELFWPLTVGAAVVVVDHAAMKSIPTFAGLVQQKKLTHMFVVPSHLKSVLGQWQLINLKAEDVQLRVVVCCGEPLPSDTIDSFRSLMPKSVDLYNVYGPTEGSMTCWRCPAELATGTVYIGAPIDNTCVVLLDRWQRPVPPGVPGEIHFGHCIARGYLNMPQLTAEKFVELPKILFPEAPPVCTTFYKTGDIGVWSDEGLLSFRGRVDRQVKVRGYRIELEAVETALRVLAPWKADGLQAAVAAVALPPAADRPGGELLGFVEAGLRAEDEAGLKQGLRDRLPAYMVPSRIIGKAEFPMLPNGKVNIRALQDMAAKHSLAAVDVQHASGPSAPASQEAVIDSLGVVRQIGKRSADLAMEARVADNLRAFFMYGVLWDHWVDCGDSGTCSAIMEDFTWKMPASFQGSAVPAWLDMIARSVGNYKDMSGFLMISAFQDSAFRYASYFSMSDATELLVYLQMIWVLDPLIMAICDGTDFCFDDINSFVGVHRWYLLLMLMIKVALVLFRMARIPPFAACCTVTIFGFIMAPEAGCLTADKCVSNQVNDPRLWIENYEVLNVVWIFFFRGLYIDIWDMQSSILNRYYILFATQYFWTFHYGRAILAAVRGRWSVLVAGIGVGKIGARRPLFSAWTFAWLASICAVVVLNLINVGGIGPFVYDYMQENAFDTMEPKLLPLLGIMLVLTTEVVLLAVVVVGIRWRFRLLGSTTLGCYVIHMYFNYAIAVYRSQWPIKSGDVVGAVTRLVLFVLQPTVFQLTIGVAFHKLLLLEAKLIFRMYSFFVSRLKGAISGRVSSRVN